jgi:fatty-acyl-CoA synthase
MTARTLVEALEAAAGGPAELVFHLREGPERLPAAELLRAARLGAATLADRGVRPGDAIGVLGPNHPRWAQWAFATWLAGGVLVPLPYHLRIPDADAFGERIRAMLEAAGCRAVLADPRFLPYLPDRVGADWSDPGNGSVDRMHPPEPTDPAVVQFTSGSTATPKGVALSHRAVLAGIRSAVAGAGFVPDQHVLLSWLPFFHDWGLFGYLVFTIAIGTTTHVLATERFARDPGEWLRLVGAVGATMTPSPTSAWEAALRSAARRSEGIDLSSLRACTLAAETIDPRVVDAMLEIGGRFGLRPEAAHPAYGLAEATLAVTVGTIGAGLEFHGVDRDELASGGVVASTGPNATRVAACGAPVPGTEVRILDAGRQVPEGWVGEIAIRGPSMMDGYLGEDEDDRALADGWLHTGDLGFLANGQLCVTGRSKDVVIVMGRNYAPQEIEWAAERVSGVRRGRSVAFGLDPDAGEVVVAVEPTGSEDPDELARMVWRSVADAIGIVPRDVVVLPRGSVPLTTSGKIRRGSVRRSFVDGDLEDVMVGSLSGIARR